MKDLKQSIKQRFCVMDFNSPTEATEIELCSNWPWFSSYRASGVSLDVDEWSVYASYTFSFCLFKFQNQLAEYLHRVLI